MRDLSLCIAPALTLSPHSPHLPRRCSTTCSTTPNRSKSSATVSFLAYRPGLYEIGLVQIVEQDSFVPHHSIGYHVFVLAEGEGDRQPPVAR